MNRGRRSARAVVLVTFVAALALATATAAFGAFPGRNGKIAYEDDGGGVSVINPDGTNWRQLAATGDNPAWSPSGQSIAYNAGRSQLFVMRADGSAKRQLTFGDLDPGPPQWSPDAAQIAFLSDNAIWIMRANGTGLSAIRNLPGDHLSGLTWSPDGRTMVFTSVYDEPYSAATYAISPGGRNLRAFPIPVEDWPPDWSPDATMIAVGNPGRVMNADGSNVRVLPSPADGNYRAPAWSPDGSQIAWMYSDERDAPHVRVTNINGGNVRELATGAIPDWQPLCDFGGTGGADTIHGTSGQDLICAGSGNDTIYGYGGNDVIFAGRGNDRVDAGAGNDVINGGDGADALYGGAGGDRIWAKDGARDRVGGGIGSDVCLADMGDAKIRCP